jgi:maltose O-acetyltransferase
MGPLTVTGEGDWAELVSVGCNSVISGPLHIDLGAAVHIGDFVHIGHHVVLLTIDHDIGPPGRRCGANKPAPIVISDGAWLAARVTILPGVTIGAGSVVAAGSVVTKDVPPNTLVAGVPARVVRQLDEA